MLCPNCKVELDTPAEEFLHQELHAGKPTEQYGNEFGLNKLPYVLMPRVARLMQDYHEAMLKKQT